MLDGWLDYHRDTLLWKLSGVGEEDLRRPMVPSGTSLLGIVKHLAYVERWWFRMVFAGEDLPVPWTETDRDADWRVEPDESAEHVIRLYREEVEHARRVVAGADLDDRAGRTEPNGSRAADVSLRWIVTHMIEETARHNGHADILRELIDGATGD